MGKKDKYPSAHIVYYIFRLQPTCLVHNARTNTLPLAVFVHMTFFFLHFSQQPITRVGCEKSILLGCSIYNAATRCLFLLCCERYLQQFSISYIYNYAYLFMFNRNIRKELRRKVTSGRKCFDQCDRSGSSSKNITGLSMTAISYRCDQECRKMLIKICIITSKYFLYLI